ncbi:MAG: CheR family methyltransferase [Bacteroidales bacterium]
MSIKQIINKEHLQIAADIIERELGLHYPATRLEELMRGFERTSELLNGSLGSEQLLKEVIKAKSIPKHIYTELSNALTINETYFFRESPAINLFKTTIIKEIEKNNGNFKIWSAGCSSGEEPFTLAIIIKEMLPTHIAKKIKIIATDISDKALKKANEGVYTEWSFRETPSNIKEKYFKAIDGKWHISNEIKKIVSFSHLNLITEEYPSLSQAIYDLNLIFCRNVLIYFSQKNIKLVANKLFNSLCEGGWLVTSQVELNSEFFPNFSKVNIDDGFFYKKEKLITPKKRAVKESPIINKSAHLKKIYKHRTETKNRTITTSNEPESIVDISLLQSAQKLANKGEYDKALVILEKLLGSDSLNLNFFYLYATILSEKGDIEKAAEFYKKCIYLNPSHILANYMLGNIYVELGKKELSTKYFRTALEQARQIDPTQEVNDSGGVSAARVIEVLENIIQEQ